ncbi:MAG: hypothetical protein CAPSK01_001640 [Candidatus Accumulibacter vicinus]|uniref:Uncharacterized protein n=1 Tax=Candidatus Accumulibacter vicinus TaxID=2954382 RepID=A0A084Y241_9PROT|nr:MAG: hypothetical protein CAPSK01_001640 [Candidatus Accumulibacter vicinus]
MQAQRVEPGTVQGRRETLDRRTDLALHVVVEVQIQQIVFKAGFQPQAARRRSDLGGGAPHPLAVEVYRRRRNDRRQVLAGRQHDDRQAELVEPRAGVVKLDMHAVFADRAGQRPQREGLRLPQLAVLELGLAGMRAVDRQPVLGRHADRQLLLAGQQRFEFLAFDQRPGRVARRELLEDQQGDSLGAQRQAPGRRAFEDETQLAGRRRARRRLLPRRLVGRPVGDALAGPPGGAAQSKDIVPGALVEKSETALGREGVESFRRRPLARRAGVVRRRRRLAHLPRVAPAARLAADQDGPLAERRGAVALRDGTAAAQPGAVGNRPGRRQRQRIGWPLSGGESLSAEQQRHREVAAQLRPRRLLGPVVGAGALRNATLEVTDQVGNQHLARAAGRRCVPAQRLDQVIGENAHVAVGAQIRELPRPARTEHGAALALGERRRERLPGRREERRRNRRAVQRRGGQRVLDPHPARVAAIEQHQQAARRQRRHVGREVGGGNRAAAHAPSFEIVGNQEILAVLLVAVAAEIDDRRRVVVGGHALGQPVEPGQDALAAALGAAQQADLVGPVGAALRVHQHVVQRARVGRDGGQRRRSFPVPVDGNQQRVGIFETTAHLLPPRIRSSAGLRR